MSDPSVAGTTVPFRTPVQVDRALPGLVAHLRAEGIIAYPTETVYGLGGGIGAGAVAAVSRLKPRGGDKRLIVLVSDAAMAAELTADGALGAVAGALAARFWPGPLTLVLLPRSRSLPDRLRGPAGAIAVRWTAHAGLARLIAAYGAPITSTSANRSGVPPAGDVGEIVEQWRDAIAAGTVRALDGGVLPPSLPSSVVDCTGGPPRLVRRGAIADDALRLVAADLITPGS